MTDFCEQVRADLARETKPFLVVSCDLAANHPDINALRRELFEEQMSARGLFYQRALGSYEGTTEVAYIVLNANEGDADKLLPLARRYGQESVLSVDFNRFATLLFLNPGNGGPDVKNYKGIGFWRELTDEEPLPESYTKVGAKVFATRQYA